MEERRYPEPFTEAAGHSAQRAAQLTSVAVAAAQGYIMYRARHAALRAAADENEARTLRNQERMAVQQARAGWAPALDARWLADAGLIETARAWGAAAPYTETDPTAATATRRAEERLRALHPYAMARYDRLRADGMTSAEAMVETGPLFARPPQAREGQAAAGRAAIAAPGDEAPSWPGRAGNDDRLAAQAEQARASDLDPAITTVPAVTSEQAAHNLAKADRQATDAAFHAARSTSDRAAWTASALAAQSFPYTIHETLARGRTMVPAPRPKAATIEQTPQRGLAR